MPAERVGRVRPMREDDLSVVLGLQRQAYGDGYQESFEVLARKRALAPASCLVWEADAGRAGAYVFAHPWGEGALPSLHQTLEALPGKADYLFLHDLVVDAALRGAGVAAGLLARLREQACGMGVGMGLVAVNGADRYWARQGFAVADAVRVPESYGADARFMRLQLV